MKKFLASLPIIILFLSLIVPAAIFGQYWLLAVFLIFGLIFGVVEAVANKFSGNTVSQHFWAFRRENKKGAAIIIVFMIIAWGCLIYHFWFQGG